MRASQHVPSAGRNCLSAAPLHFCISASCIISPLLQLCPRPPLALIASRSSLGSEAFADDLQPQTQFLGNIVLSGELRAFWDASRIQSGKGVLVHAEENRSPFPIGKNRSTTDEDACLLEPPFSPSSYTHSLFGARHQLRSLGPIKPYQLKHRLSWINKGLISRLQLGDISKYPEATFISSKICILINVVVLQFQA